MVRAETTNPPQRQANEHDRIVRALRDKGESRIGEEEVVHQHAHHSRGKTVGDGSGKTCEHDAPQKKQHGGNRHAQVHLIHDQTQYGGYRLPGHRKTHVFPREPDKGIHRTARHLAGHILIGDRDDGQTRRKLRQTVSRALAHAEKPLRIARRTHHYTAYAGSGRVLRNLHHGVVAVYRHHGGSQLLGKLYVGT